MARPRSRGNARARQLASAQLVLDLARLHVPTVVIAIGLEEPERTETAEGEAR